MTLAQKIDTLIASRTGQGRQLSYVKLAALSDQRISPSYFFKLRTGAMLNPGYSTLVALSETFDVPLCYFAPDGTCATPVTAREG